jgi:hypothetical protein
MMIKSNVSKRRMQSLPITKIVVLTIGVLLLTSVAVTAAANETIPSLLPESKQAFARQASIETELGSVLKLARTNVPIDIPLQKGYENGNEIYFIATDASDEETAAYATNLTGFKVNYAPTLTQIPDTASAEAYAFTSYRQGLAPLMTGRETKHYAVQAVLRATIREDFASKLGNLKHSIGTYDRLIRATIPVIIEDNLQARIFLLLSFDLGTNV